MSKKRGKSLSEWKTYSDKDKPNIPIRTSKYIVCLEEVINLNVSSNKDLFTTDEVLGFSEHCRLTNKMCTHEELDKWKINR